MRDFIRLLRSYLEYFELLGVESVPAWPEVKSFLDLDPLVPETLEDLVREIRSCRKCGLSRTRTQPVPGEGPSPSSVMLVGEAPGREEDLEGRPFVGAAGKLLDRMLAAVGLKRSEIYITNVVKCRPPGNRTPEREELEACRPYLARQIRLVKPRAILALGAVAARSLLLTEEPLSRIRGKVHHLEGIPVVPTYHPAYLLRNPAAKRAAWEDLQLFQGLIREGK
ncbi:uracil-DNA glycosylase [Thermosulfurimonas sp. F29]|uniref:uracil-DNA glycosylase n=1 Tax=Thermosulfurimonas sp. F29 TaxID=2867247 RepID=UPI001C829D00|nr:uracil-DNA glycosylase [Thermosulfurimonas sp. F29]MBX6423542.1 uracil-DNA glycosylase [Thermosulfurimonas sp. F29]